MARLFLIGHFGGRNAGDDAMLLGTLCGITSRMTGTTELFVLSKSGNRDHTIPATVPIPVIVVKRRPKEVLRAILRSQWVVLAGGTHFHDDYGYRRLIRHYGYMCAILVILLAAKLFRRRIALLSQGVGPVRLGLGRLLTSCVLRTADFITVRDSKSVAEARALCQNLSNVRKAFDVAVLLSSALQEGDVPIENRLGVAPTWLHGAEARVGCSTLEFWECVAHQLAQVCAERNLQLCFFAFRTGNRESDVKLANYMADIVWHEMCRDVDVIEYDLDPIALLGAVSACKYFIACRYHSLLFAYMASRPVLAIAYHRKVADLAAEIQLPEEAVIVLSPSIRSTIGGRIAHLLDTPERFVARSHISNALHLAALNFEFLGGQLP